MAWSVGAGREGKGVIVTGAAGSIGREVAEAFATTGARVMAVDLEQNAVEAVVASMEGEGHIAVGADLRNLAVHDALVNRARDELGSLYVLAHLSAVLRRRYNIDEVTQEDWEFQVDLNLKASFFLCRSAALVMREQDRGGRIITFTSQGWRPAGFGGSVVYNTAKGAIVTSTRGMAHTYGTRPVTVNAVASGLVMTSMLPS